MNEEARRRERGERRRVSPIEQRRAADRRRASLQRDALGRHEHGGAADDHDVDLAARLRRGGRPQHGAREGQGRPPHRTRITVVVAELLPTLSIATALMV